MAANVFVKRATMIQMLIFAQVMNKITNKVCSDQCFGCRDFSYCLSCHPSQFK